MRTRTIQGLALVVTCLWLAVTGVAARQEQAELTKAQMREFLEKARIVSGKQEEKGVTHPSRLTLSDGSLTHDASFQAIDERKALKTFDNAKPEPNFVDSYQYNIAAYELAELLGLDGMMPMSVERRWRDKKGSCTWFIDDVVMDEGQRLKTGAKPPDIDAWNKQLYRMRVFSQLVYDTDRNLTNMLITKDWKVWMIDFTRAFRLWPDLQSTKDLSKCDRALLDRLRRLTENEVETQTKKFLTRAEIKAVMARRDKIVAHFDQLIAEQGEAQVLY